MFGLGIIVALENFTFLVWVISPFANNVKKFFCPSSVGKVVNVSLFTKIRHVAFPNSKLHSIIAICCIERTITILLIDMRTNSIS